MQIRAGWVSATFALLLVFSPPAGAQPEGALAPGRYLGACDVTFSGTSTLHDFSGTAHCRPFTVLLERDPTGGTVLRSLEVEVPVPGMNTGNRRRDRQMREMFESGRFPKIRGTVRDVDLDRLRGEIGRTPDGRSSLDLFLRIRDVERTVRATVRNAKESPERIEFGVEFPVALSEFGLEPPSVLGVIRVHDTVRVKAAFTLTASPSP